MRRTLTRGLALLLTLGVGGAQVNDWPLRLRSFRTARKLHARGKIARAHKLYQRAARLPKGTPELQRRVLTRLNEHRMHAMVVPVMPHTAVRKAAEAHARYLRIHTHTRALSLKQAHGEIPGTEGYTGKSVGVRILHQGAAGGSTEAVTAETDPEGAVDILMNSVYHRSGLLRQEARYAGFGVTTQSVLDLFWEKGDEDEIDIAYYPGPGQKAVPPRFPGGETPDPMPGVRYPVGSPISIGGSGEPPELLDFSLEGPEGRLDLELLEEGTVPSHELLGDWIYLMPVKQLQSNTGYRVRAKVKLAGGRVRKLNWSFSTGEGVPGEQWVRILNLEMPQQDLREGKPVRFLVRTKASHPDLLRVTWTVDGKEMQSGPDHEFVWKALPGPHRFDLRLDYPTESRAFMVKSFQVYVPGAPRGNGQTRGEFEVEPLPPWKPGTTVHFRTRPIPGSDVVYRFFVNGEKIAEGPRPEASWKAKRVRVRELKVDAVSPRSTMSRMLYAPD